MTFNKSMKLALLVAYVNIMLSVPPFPNYYTFAIDTIGFSTTMIASSLLIHFLNTRPVNQKNLLNRILALGVIVGLLSTVRNYIMAVVTCFFHSELQEFDNKFPALAASFLSMRITGGMEAVLVCCLSIGRLLLFAVPVVFHNLNPTTGVIAVGLGVFAITVVDTAYNWITCYSVVETPISSIILNFQAEMGLSSYSRVLSFNSTHLNVTEEEIEDSYVCHPLPITPLFLLSTILLEIARLVIVLYKKGKTLSRINPAPVSAPPVSADALVSALPISAAASASAPLISADASVLAPTVTEADPVSAPPACSGDPKVSEDIPPSSILAFMLTTVSDAYSFPSTSALEPACDTEPCASTEKSKAAFTSASVSYPTTSTHLPSHIDSTSASASVPYPSTSNHSPSLIASTSNCITEDTKFTPIASTCPPPAYDNPSTCQGNAVGRAGSSVIIQIRPPNSVQQRTRFRRAESFPTRSRHNVHINQKRRNSLQMTARHISTSTKVAKTLVNSTPKTQPILPRHNITLTHFREVTKELFLRTSSIVTGTALLCLVLTVANLVHIYSTAFIVVVERRFCQYCMIVLIASLDKDLIEYYMNKFE